MTGISLFLLLQYALVDIQLRIVGDFY